MGDATLIVRSQAAFNAALQRADQYGVLLIYDHIENLHGTFPHVTSLRLLKVPTAPVGLILPSLQEVQFMGCTNVTQEWYTFPATKYQYSGCTGPGPVVPPVICENLVVYEMGDGVQIDLRRNKGASLVSMVCCASSVLVDDTTRLPSLRDLTLLDAEPNTLELITRNVRTLVTFDVNVDDRAPRRAVLMSVVRAIREPVLAVLARNDLTLRNLRVPPGMFTDDDIKTLVAMPVLERLNVTASPRQYALPTMDHYLWLVRLAIAAVQNHSGLTIRLSDPTRLDMTAFKVAAQMLGMGDDAHRVFGDELPQALYKYAMAGAVENQARMERRWRGSGVEVPVNVLRHMSGYLKIGGKAPHGRTGN